MTRLLPMASRERRLVDNTNQCNVWRFEEGGFPDHLIIFGRRVEKLAPDKRPL
jgi:hypothetical protein